MPEYRKQIDTPPVILHRKDIEGVARFFEPTVEERSSASFSFSSGDATFRAQSIEQLLQHDLPPVVDSLYFSVTNYDRHHGITLSLSKRHGNYNINAIDETWFKGKIQQINDFLSARRPWYLPISSFWISGLVSGCIFALFTAFAFFISQHSILGGSLAGL